MRSPIVSWIIPKYSFLIIPFLRVVGKRVPEYLSLIFIEPYTMEVYTGIVYSIHNLCHWQNVALVVEEPLYYLKSCCSCCELSDLNIVREIMTFISVRLVIHYLCEIFKALSIILYVINKSYLSLINLKESDSHIITDTKIPRCVGRKDRIVQSSDNAFFSAFCELL